MSTTLRSPALVAPTRVVSSLADEATSICGHNWQENEPFSPFLSFMACTIIILEFRQMLKSNERCCFAIRSCYVHTCIAVACVDFFFFCLTDV